MKKEGFLIKTKKIEKINRSMQEGESEQDPLEWIDILEDCLDELFARKSNRSVKAIAVDGTSGTIFINSRASCGSHAQ